MNDHWRQNLIEAARKVIRTEKVLRANPISWAACGPNPNTKEGRAYMADAEAHKWAEMELWNLTDIEYDEEPLYAACWQWRYCKVMARKCCWLQLKHPVEGSRMAGELMQNLHMAESNLMGLLGLMDEYKSPCQYLEEAFPGLKKGI